jgi:Ca2+/Na+ antiporter
VTGVVTLEPGHGWALAVFPLLAGVVALAFAFVLVGRLVSKWRPHEAVWAAALVMYAVASFAAAVGVANGWTATEYRMYWLFGAVLNVPYLAQGEAYLLVRRRRIAHVLLVVLVALSVAATIIVWTSSVNIAELAKALPLGNKAWQESRLPYHLRWLSWIGYIALVGGLVWSARTMGSNPELRNRTGGILIIALGATIVAIGSGVGAGLDVVPLFAIALAAGIAVMFWGFILSSRPAPRPLSERTATSSA